MSKLATRNSTISRLESYGYKVKRLGAPDLPASRRTIGVAFYRLTIAGEVVQNYQDKFGLYTDGDLARFADRLPKVNQPALL